MLYARPSSGGNVPWSPVGDAEAAFLLICSTTIQYQVNHTTTHQRNHLSTYPDSATTWKRKRCQHNAPSQNFAECVSTTSNAVKSMLPAEENCKRSTRHHRPQLPSPSSLQQLTIPPEFAATLDEDPQPFLFYDNGPDKLYHIMLYRVHLTTDKMPWIFQYITKSNDGIHIQRSPHSFNLSKSGCIKILSLSN